MLQLINYVSNWNETFPYALLFQTSFFIYQTHVPSQIAMLMAMAIAMAFPIVMTSFMLTTAWVGSTRRFAQTATQWSDQSAAEKAVHFAGGRSRPAQSEDLKLSSSDTQPIVAVRLLAGTSRTGFAHSIGRVSHGEAVRAKNSFYNLNLWLSS